MRLGCDGDELREWVGQLRQDSVVSAFPQTIPKPAASSWAFI